jgi:hypothetical protein
MTFSLIMQFLGAITKFLLYVLSTIIFFVAVFKKGMKQEDSVWLIVIATYLMVWVRV